MLLKSMLRGAFSFCCLLSGCSRKMVDNVVVGLTVVVVGLTVVVVASFESFVLFAFSRLFAT